MTHWDPINNLFQNTVLMVDGKFYQIGTPTEVQHEKIEKS